VAVFNFDTKVVAGNNIAAVKRARRHLSTAVWWLIGLDSRMMELGLGLFMFIFGLTFYYHPAYQGRIDNPIREEMEKYLTVKSWGCLMFAMSFIRVMSVLLERTQIRLWWSAIIAAWWVFMWWVFSRVSPTPSATFVHLAFAAMSFLCWCHVWVHGAKGGKGADK